LIIATPSLIRDVRAAAYPSATIGSSTLRYTGSTPEPSGTSSRWNVHSDAYPAASARSAKAVRYPGVAHAPATGAPNPIFMPHTLVKAILAERSVVHSSGHADPHARVAAP
jgi:hypothetical protein